MLTLLWSFTSCIISGKLLNLSEPSVSPPEKWGDKKVFLRC